MDTQALKKTLKMRTVIPDKKRDKHLRYYYRNREVILKKRKADYDKKKSSETNRINYIKNRERILGYKRKHRAKFREEYNEKARIRRKNSKEKPTDYLKKYGMNKDDYALMFKNQKGKCAICRRVEKNKRLAVDHCHKSGKVRGLLCARCNTSIGGLNDDYRLLEKAVLYLKKYL